MTWPTGGDRGWEALGATEDIGGNPIQTDPISYPLPVPEIADWYDPAPLHGAGGIRPSVSYHIGASDVVVRGAVEARFTDREVFGVAILDSIGVFHVDCSLTLTVFDDDGLTALWEVSTDPLHIHPYLVEPDNYGEQELDFAQGRATLGTVRVVVIDPAQIPGDQDGGWLTEKLARDGLPDVAGRRCLLTRFISADFGEQIIIDGPAGFPQMDSSYAAFAWDIRDVRDVERKIRCFDLTGRAESGLRSLVPDELVDGYGFDPDTSAYLQRPGIPMVGHCNRHPFYPSPAVCTLSVGASEFPAQLRCLLIWQAAYDAVMNGIGRAQGPQFPNPDFVFRWRAEGSSDPWNEIPGDFLHITLSTEGATITDGARVVGQVVIQDNRVNPLHEQYDPTAADLPTEDQIVEFYLLGVMPPDELHPVVIDPVTVPGVDSPLNEDGDTLLGRFELQASIGGTSVGLIDLVTVPGNAEAIRRQTVPIFNRLGNLSTVDDIFIPSSGVFRWRAAGSGDPFTEILLAPAASGGNGVLVEIVTPLLSTFRVFKRLQLTADDADVPTTGEDIEFTLLYEVGAPETLQTTTGVTAGQFLKNLYDGIYSARGSNNELQPTGIRYDGAALLAMTDFVRIRLDKPIEDARTWAEQNIYSPTGWAPALDNEGRISPVSQVAPSSTAHLPAITNDAAEPSPDWNAGSRVINLLRFTYPRDYAIGPPDPPPPLGFGPQERQNIVKSQDILVEFRDDVSIARHGEQMLELQGLAFHALGRLTTGGEEQALSPPPLDLQGLSVAATMRIVKSIWSGAKPVTETPVVNAGLSGLPVSGDIRNEVGWQLALLRLEHLLNRYSLGAPAFGLNVRRSEVPTLRAGSWAIVDLSWLPDYVTRRRGLLALVQVLSIGDLDCAWRRVLLERVLPSAAESS